MASPMVASAAAASSDPAWAYPAAKPATAASVPHTSASPNRSRHARHHPARRSGTGAASAPPAVTTATAATSTDTPLIAPPTSSTESGSEVLIHLRTGLHQAALVGENDGLGAVAQPEFHQHAADVGLDGLFGDDQVGGDLRVGHAPGHQGQHLGLAFGEVLELPPVRAARRAQPAEPPAQPAGHAR